MFTWKAYAAAFVLAVLMVAIGSMISQPATIDTHVVDLVYDVQDMPPAATVAPILQKTETPELQFVAKTQPSYQRNGGSCRVCPQSGSLSQSQNQSNGTVESANCDGGGCGEASYRLPGRERRAARRAGRRGCCE